MTRKRMILLFSLLLTAALLLTACPASAPAPAGGEEAAPEATEAPAEEEVAEEAGDAEASGEQVEIEYWQYNFEARVDAMNQLIEMFEAENPDIKVIHNSDIPYADFRDKISASVPAGVGPDAAAWVSAWADAAGRCGFAQLLALLFDPTCQWP